MISFKVINDISDVDLKSLPDREECTYILSELLSMTDVEIAYSVFDGALVVRMCDDGDYVFDYPYSFSDTDMGFVLCEIADYARRELIPLVFTNVPREELDVIADLFPRVTAQAFEEDIDTFVVKVENEISELGEFPEIELDGITLKKIEECDAHSYFNLCTDEQVNRYWGYDYRLDNPTPASEYFYNVAVGEFEAGVALALGIYAEERFVGECVMYDFDYVGNCEIGVRLIRNEQSKGYAGKTIRALFELARQLGLKSVLTRVMKENAPAIRFVEKYMNFEHSDNCVHLYRYTL